jgi:hypothetical protein
MQIGAGEFLWPVLQQHLCRHHDIANRLLAPAFTQTKTGLNSSLIVLNIEQGRRDGSLGSSSAWEWGLHYAR